MTNYKRLTIWNKGFDIAVNSLKFVKTLPKHERYTLGQQITESGISIPSNIAEGSSRSSRKDFYRFMQISLGSSFELETQILIAEAAEYGQVPLKNILLKDLDEEQKMLITFMKRLSQ